MKNTLKNILGLLLGIVVLASCEINDPINELAHTGNIAANVYMEIPSANVVAGNSVSFHAEYWSVDKQFESLSVGYSINAYLKYTITAVSTKYTYTLDSMQIAREYQPIKAFDHSEGNFDEEKNAFVIDDDFPVSYTLATVSIENEETYNDDLVSQLFPEQAISEFYEGFFATLDYALMKEFVVTVNNIVDEETFETHWNTETVENPDGGDPIEVKTMKEESVPVLMGYVDQIPLEQIVYNPNKFIYEIGYTRTYELETRFRVVNGTGVENFSDEKRISVN